MTSLRLGIIKRHDEISIDCPSLTCSYDFAKAEELQTFIHGVGLQSGHWPSIAADLDLSARAAFHILTNKKTARFCRAVFRFTNRICYSPLPKRRDHHPARRGWVSLVVSESDC
jgi:hypothetical protein